MNGIDVSKQAELIINDPKLPVRRNWCPECFKEKYKQWLEEKMIINPLIYFAHPNDYSYDPATLIFFCHKCHCRWHYAMGENGFKAIKEKT